MNTEFKGTPGEWSVETVAINNGHGICHKIGPFPSADFKRANYACIYGDGIRKGIDESLPIAQALLANALVMAASKDLLNELIRAEEVLRINGFTDRADYARAAITKALKGTA